MAEAGERWIRFLRQYGPIARNDNMFDEHIRRSAGRLSVQPVTFKHPIEDDVLSVFRGSGDAPKSVILTGTAGDGKSYLCGRVWQDLGGTAATWASDDVYFKLPLTLADRPVTLHVIRDLTALPEEDAYGRYEFKAALLEQLSAVVFQPCSEHLFLIAANDGQLIETWRKLGPVGNAARSRALFEARLMQDDDPEPGAQLHFFNLSAVSSAIVLSLSLDALLAHDGWQDCYVGAQEDGFFGPRCPI